MEMGLGCTGEDTRMWDSLGETGTVAKDLGQNARLLDDTDISEEIDGDVDFESPDTTVETFDRPLSLSKPSSTTSMAMLNKPAISATMDTTSEATLNPGVRTDDDDMDIGYWSDYSDATLEGLPGHIDMTTCLNRLTAFGTVVDDIDAEFMADDHGTERTDNSEDPTMLVCGKEVANREGITSVSVLEERSIRGTSSTMAHPTGGRPSGIGADEDSATSTVGLLDPCITESISGSAEMDDHTTIQGFIPQQSSEFSLFIYLWFLFSAFRSLSFMKLEYLSPTKTFVTPQDLFTAMTFSIPICIILGRAVATVLRKVTRPLWGLGSLLFSAVVILSFHNSIPETPLQQISDILYFIFDDWSITPQLSFTIFFMSVAVFVAAGQAVRHSLTHRHLPNISTHATIDLTKSTDPRDSVALYGPSFQPGLGTLSCLPPEVRSEIWQQLFLDATPNTPECRPDIYWPEPLTTIQDDIETRTARRKRRILFVLEAVRQPELLPDRQRDYLAIMRTSKQLHVEVDGDFYRNRTLTFCFDINQHSLLLQRIGGKPTDYYITLGNICVARDFANTDFSKFKALHLDIELPSNVCSLDKLKDLGTHLEEFSKLLQVWQSRKFSTAAQPWCPRIEIAFSLCKGTQLYHVEGTGSPWWEISIMNINNLLRPLRDIDNVEDVKIKLLFGLRYGNEWLPQVLYEVIHQMKQFGNDSWRVDLKGTGRMCREAYDLTHDTLGSEVGGSLSGKPPDCPPARQPCSLLEHIHDDLRILEKLSLSYPQKDTSTTRCHCDLCDAGWPGLHSSQYALKADDSSGITTLYDNHHRGSGGDSLSPDDDKRLWG
ncbi:MAG: hypothetical protein Q9172_001925 [Xanthocarpia lactea]